MAIMTTPKVTRPPMYGTTPDQQETDAADEQVNVGVLRLVAGDRRADGREDRGNRCVDAEDAEEGGEDGERDARRW